MQSPPSMRLPKADTNHQSPLCSKLFCMHSLCLQEKCFNTGLPYPIWPYPILSVARIFLCCKITVWRSAFLLENRQKPDRMRRSTTRWRKRWPRMAPGSLCSLTRSHTRASARAPRPSAPRIDSAPAASRSHSRATR